MPVSLTTINPTSAKSNLLITTQTISVTYREVGPEKRNVSVLEGRDLN